MRIFVAGGTGVLGRRVLPRLVAAGHDVRAVARSDEKADLVRSLGAEPVRVSLFEPAALTEAVAGSDAVLNLATHIPPMSKMADLGNWAENDRIRIEGSANLVDAALATGARLYLQESIAFAVADGGARWLDESAPLLDGPVSAGVAGAEASAARFADSAAGAGGRGVVLRFAQFHAPDADHTLATLRAARHGFGAVFGAPDAYRPVIHAADAADAVVAAVSAPAAAVPSGAYLVVDDEPLTRDAYVAALAGAVGSRRLHPPPQAVGRAAAERGGDYLTASQRLSNRKFREATGWRPAHRSAVETWRDVARDAGEADRGGTVAAGVGLVVLLVGALVVGVWALVAPQSFYDGFPGFGRSWVSPDGPYNEHLLRDVGALNLAVAALTGWALVSMRRPLVQAAALVSLLWGLPHAAYHVTHLHGFAEGDAVGMTVSLLVPVVAAVGVLLASRRPSVGRHRAPAPGRPAPHAALGVTGVAEGGIASAR